MAENNGFGVYIAYVDDGEDTAWVRYLASRLHKAGLDPFLDKWEIQPGDVVVRKLEEGIARSASAVMVFNPAWEDEPWAREQYDTLMRLTVEAGRTFVPVLHRTSALPAFVANRRVVDFSGAGGTESPEWERRFAELVAALRGDEPSRDAAHVGDVRADHPTRMLLYVTADKVSFGPDESGAEPLAVQPHHGVGHALRDRVWQLGRIRDRRSSAGLATRAASAPTVETGLTEALRTVGVELGEAFLSGPVGEKLTAALDEAARQNTALRLGVQVDDEALADLPWETAVPPGLTGPLALHPHVELYRRLPSAVTTTAMGIRAPLRILAVMAAPDGGGSLLDLEAEHALILKQVESARHRAGAHVTVLNEGTLAAIEKALKQERFHVLHISCHAGPGVLLLEDENGAVDEVTAERLATAIPVDRGVPLIVLSGCSTALTAPAPRTAPASDPPGEPDSGETALGGLARDLAAAGMPAVLAMTAPVTDRYATRLAGRLYYELAVRDRPEPLAALSEARRDLERERFAQPPGSVEAALAEWATPALFLRGPSLPLYDLRDGVDEIEPPTAHRLADGVIVREVGEFVGRRAELRALSRTLRGDGPGVLLHGIGGVGKSTLAAELATRLGRRTRFTLSSVGTTTPDGLLSGIANDLFAATATAAPDEPLRRLATFVRDPRLPWQVRLQALGEHLLDPHPVTILLDNFEDNLDHRDGSWHLRDEELAAFLSAWIQRPGLSKLIITSRHPFPLPADAHTLLHTHHLGPLSPAEAVQLIWRLDALNALPPTDQLRALADVGGHPRTLEYLDALLRSGTTRFPDIARRLENLLARRGITHPAAWFRDFTPAPADTPQDPFDRALAEAVTLAVDDVLLGDLVDGLDELALRVLVGASVFRVPVEAAGVAWSVSQVVEREPDAEAEERLARVRALLAEARRSNPEAGVRDVGLSPEEVERVLADERARLAAPLAPPEGWEQAVGVLARAGLLTPLPAPGPDLAGRWVVHRWTASSVTAGLGGRVAEGLLAVAHGAAADFWSWRVRVWPQGREAVVDDLLEARFHLHAAGRLDEALNVNDAVCGRLHMWGAWGREEQLYRETLTWLPDTSGRSAAVSYHQLGNIAQEQGEYGQALEYYQQSLTILEELGDRAGVGSSYHQLGRVAQDRGEYERALEYYQQSLTISEELGDRAGVGSSYHQLGMVAQLRGEYERALEYYQQSLTIFEELGDRVGVGRSYGQLGMVAQLRGEYERALEYYQQALTIFEELGDRAGVGSSYHQLGMVAHDRGEYGWALEYYQQSLTILEEVGDRAGVGRSYHQLGTVAQVRGEYDRALEYYQQSLTVFEEVGDRAGAASSISQTGVLYTETGRAAEAVPRNLQALAIRLQLQIPQAAIDLHWLRQQLTELGDQAFNDLLTEHLDPRSVTNLLNMLDE